LKIADFWSSVCETVRRMLSAVVCLFVCPALSCLSVTLMYCGQMAGWIKLKLDTKLGMGPGHIVLDGDLAPPPQRDRAALFVSAHVYCSQMVVHLSYC